MAVRERPAKTEKFDLRLSEQEEFMIKEAAKLQHTSTAAFIRQQAVSAAESVIHERTRIVVSAEQWQSIEDRLNSPPKELPKLKAMLAQGTEWNR